MEKFTEHITPETAQAAEDFIRRVESGILKKKTLPNHAEEYPLQKAAESFDAFLNSPEVDILLGKKRDS